MKRCNDLDFQVNVIRKYKGILQRDEERGYKGLMFNLSTPVLDAFSRNVNER